MVKTIKPINETDSIRLYVMKVPKKVDEYAFKIFTPSGVKNPDIIPKKYIDNTGGIIIYPKKDINFLTFMDAIAKEILKKRQK